MTWHVKLMAMGRYRETVFTLGVGSKHSFIVLYILPEVKEHNRAGTQASNTNSSTLCTVLLIVGCLTSRSIFYIYSGHVRIPQYIETIKKWDRVAQPCQLLLMVPEKFWVGMENVTSFSGCKSQIWKSSKEVFNV